MLERKILSSFFFCQLIELFHRTMKKIENPAKYELFLSKPLTLTFFFDCLVALKGLKLQLNSYLRGDLFK